MLENAPLIFYNSSCLRFCFVVGLACSLYAIFVFLIKLFFYLKSRVNDFFDVLNLAFNFLFEASIYLAHDNKQALFLTMH